MSEGCSLPAEKSPAVKGQRGLVGESCTDGPNAGHMLDPLASGLTGDEPPRPQREPTMPPRASCQALFSFLSHLIHSTVVPWAWFCAGYWKKR